MRAGQARQLPTVQAVKLTLAVTLPSDPAHSPAETLAGLLEHFAWGLRRDAEGLGPQLIRQGMVIGVALASIEITEVNHAA